MFWEEEKKAAAQAPVASEMWDREGVTSKGVEDDAENPALNRKRRPSQPAEARNAASPDGGGAPSAGGGKPPDDGNQHDDDDAPRPCCGGFYKKGWFWACLAAVVIVCIAAPVGLATQKKIDAEGMNPQALTPKSAKGTYDKWAAAGGGGSGNGAAGLLFDPVSGTFSTGDGNSTVDVSKLTCAELQGDAPPPVSPPEGKPPPALASAADLDPAALAGATWPGFDDGRTTFLAGLSTGDGWASGDLASAAYSLRAAGARAVRVPFAFTDLYTLPPRAAAHNCGSPAPGAADLARGAGASASDAAAAALARPEAGSASAAALCNNYVPAAGSSTLSRFLYTVQTLVESGHYAVLAYAPPGGGGGEAVVEAPESLAASWARLWAALACLPGYGDRLAGRVLAEPLATPRANGIAWDNTKGGANATAVSVSAAPPLADYYGAAADAIEARSAAEGGAGSGPLYVVAGTPAQASAFAGSKPYARRVVSASELYSGAAAKAAAWQAGAGLSGARPWTADATEGTGAVAARKGAKAAQEAALGDGKYAPGTVAAARAAAKQAAADGVVEIETGRRR